MEPADVPIVRATFDAASLMAQTPPRFAHRNKLAVYERCCPPGAAHRGAITYSRWAQRATPTGATWGGAGTVVALREDAFGYEPEPAPDGRPTVAWYLNFAHTILFVAYAGPLFAQDEQQVVEHPALGALRERLKDTADPALRPVTREGGAATPVLLRGVERRCAVATDASLDDDRPYGLYGNAFARARAESVLRATRVLDPPTVTNLIAMEAPPGGDGRYTRAQIDGVFATAYAGFRAARAESAFATGRDDAEVVVHTGHWGTGAYGGDKVLMAMLQVLAAKAAGVGRVAFHTFDARGAGPCREALARLDALAAKRATVGEALAAIDAAGFAWGDSDGN